MTYATITDVTALGRALTPSETAKATELLSVVSDAIRVKAQQVGKNFDAMILNDEALANVARSVVVDVVIRSLNADASGSGESQLSQFSQSALGYSVSGTYANAGGGLFIKNNEFARLGLCCQRIGTIDMMGGGHECY